MCAVMVRIRGSRQGGAVLHRQQQLFIVANALVENALKHGGPYTTFIYLELDKSG